ncbi:MAG: glycosyltransferase [Bacteroidota bacterium]
MTFDIVITTYNRPVETARLIREILSCTQLPEQVIVVDSSDRADAVLQKTGKVTYIRSAHKNQPFQRMLGVKSANADVVVFFDDDLEIVDKRIFEWIMAPYNNTHVVGSAINFTYENGIDQHLPGHFNIKSKWAGLFLLLTGAPSPGVGKYSWQGATGPKPAQTGYVETFSGAQMSFRRAEINTFFSSALFDTFESRMGMGEDKVISYAMSKKGLLVYNPVIGLKHPANESNYYEDMASFTAKVIFSRLLLNIEYARQNGKAPITGYLLFYWYALCRLMIAVLSWMVFRTNTHKQKVKGTYQGILLTLKKRNAGSVNWHNELNSTR